MKDNYKQIDLTKMNNQTKEIIIRTEQKTYIDIKISDDEQNKTRNFLLGLNKKSNYKNIKLNEN